ncbi:MAG: hypothetical protein WDO19_21595 [Bacteroidota bacterium]
MKKLLAFLLFIPMPGITQGKNVVNPQRLFPEVNKVLQFEKALATHARKYHTGSRKWRVFEIRSRPGFSGYHVTEKSNTWNMPELLF